MGKTVTARLRVSEALAVDEYKDIARVHWEQRGRPSIKIGRIVKLTVVGGKPRIVAIRGLADKDKGKIRLDFVNRDEMKLNLDQEYEFEIQTTGIWEKLVWACTATDPAARIAAWIAVISGVFGVLGLVLGIIGVYPVVKEIYSDWHKSPAIEVSPISPPPG